MRSSVNTLFTAVWLLKPVKRICLLTVVLISVHACNTGSRDDHRDSLSFHVEPAPEWTNLFKRDHGWFGGDGIFAFVPGGNEQQGAAGKEDVVIWFSDSMLGDIVNDSLQPGYTMINNTVAVLKGGKPDSAAIDFYWDTTGKGHPKSVFIPQTPASQQGEYYWLGDGFVNTELNNDIYIFGYRVKNIPGVAVFGFKQTGSTLIKSLSGSQPPYTHTVQFDIPFLADKDADSVGSFGAGVLVNTQKAGAPNADGYVYVYGVRGKNKEVIAARVKAEDIEQFSKWTFWNGKSWTPDVETIQPVADHASNELSVTPIEGGRYVMVFQKDAIGTQIGLRVGTSPVGPFGPVQDVFDTKPDLAASPNLFSYNAKAHPVLSQPGELLISYNINSFDFNNDIRKLPHLYRPRFIRLVYK
ncbi:MAG: DUF4185 domain-containing protein [Chitinophagaceae bacterium]|nr:DUF4185 domain-containing protein [Chitinophagaceae bacterium]